MLIASAYGSFHVFMLQGNGRICDKLEIAVAMLQNRRRESFQRGEFCIVKGEFWSLVEVFFFLMVTYMYILAIHCHSDSCSWPMDFRDYAIRLWSKSLLI